MNVEARDSGPKRMVARLAVMVAATLISLLACEGLARYAARASGRPDEFLNIQNTIYQHDPLLGWKPRPLLSATFTGCTTIQVVNNTAGFRDDEPRAVRPEKSILFLGDSFMWGFDVEASERLTEVLERGDSELEAFNYGVNGFGTDQEYLLLKSVLPKLKPDTVVVLFCGNDRDDNSTNVRSGYFKPVFTGMNNSLLLNGVPVPVAPRYYGTLNPWLARNSEAFRVAIRIANRLYTRARKIEVSDPTERLVEAIQDECNRHDAGFILAFIHYDTALASFCSTRGIRVVNLQQPTFHENERLYWPGQGYHWTRKGHELAAQQLRKFLY